MTQVKFLIGDIKDLNKLDKESSDKDDTVIKSNEPKRDNDISNLKEVNKKEVIIE